MYEYFDHKEEIMLTAMLLELKKNLKTICFDILTANSFEEKYDKIIQWLLTHMKGNLILRQMMIARYSNQISESSCFLVAQMLESTDAMRALESVLRAGERQKLFAYPENELKAKTAFSTFVLFVSIYLKPDEFGNPSLQEIKDYCYQLFIIVL